MQIGDEQGSGVHAAAELCDCGQELGEGIEGDGALAAAEFGEVRAGHVRSDGHLPLGNVWVEIEPGIEGGLEAHISNMLPFEPTAKFFLALEFLICSHISMKAKIQLLDLLLSVVLPLTKSPDKGISSAATDELQELARRRKRLLKQEGGNSETEGAPALAA